MKIMAHTNKVLHGNRIIANHIFLNIAFGLTIEVIGSLIL